MRVNFLASVLLMVPLMLTGCGGASTAEEQTKLVEYENCLEIHRALFLDNYKQYPSYESEEKEERVRSIQKYTIEQCKKYRPQIAVEFIKSKREL